MTIVVCTVIMVHFECQWLLRYTVLVYLYRTWQDTTSEVTSSSRFVVRIVLIVNPLRRQIVEILVSKRMVFEELYLSHDMYFSCRLVSQKIFTVFSL